MRSADSRGKVDFATEHVQTKVVENFDRLMPLSVMEYIDSIYNAVFVMSLLPTRGVRRHFLTTVSPVKIDEALHVRKPYSLPLTVARQNSKYFTVAEIHSNMLHIVEQLS